jgi:NTP pyrophosphatase (non-canonical NTP hydrolase)
LETDLLLIHSEISEACEALRKDNLYMLDRMLDEYKFNGSVEEELADAVIRIFHVAEKNGFDICKAVEQKHHYNTKRPYRHGNKRF